jgi:membrane protease subunit HflC
MSARIQLFVFLTGLVLLGLYLSVFIVDEREKVIKFRFGQIQQSEYEPGIHFKVPLINDVKRFDGRVLTVDVQPQEYFTGEKEQLLVDSFILWRVADVAKYYTAMGGDRLRAQDRLFNIVNNALRDSFATRTVQELVSGDRGTMVTSIIDSTKDTVADFGIEVVNIRIKRIDFPSDINTRVFDRMRSERERIAKETRAEGAEEAEKIRADAEKQRAVIVAEARKSAEELRGEGDAKATEIYANAYGKDEAFYSLYRRLTAYPKVFSSDDMLVIEPKGDFFKRFNDPIAE